MKCDIIIPIWNQPKLTRSCIDHIIKNTGYPYKLILIDNGSDLETRQYLENLKDNCHAEINLVRNENNLGFVKAVNQGFGLSDSAYVCIMNNDTEASPGWLERLVEFAESHKDVGIMNPRCDGDPALSLEEHAEVFAGQKGEYTEKNQCFGFCMLIKREVVDKIGYLDEVFGIGCYDDTDYSMRACMAGYRCVDVHSSYVRHIHSISFKAMGNRDLLVAQCEKEYFKKWPRHLRAGVSFTLNSNTKDAEIRNFSDGMLFLAQEWCWVNLWIFNAKGKDKERVLRILKESGTSLHQNIRLKFFPKEIKYLQLIARILGRSFGVKRRKKYDMLITDDGMALLLFKIIHPIHGAKTFLISLKKDIRQELNRILLNIRGMNVTKKKV